MRKAILGKKMEMTQIFDANGKVVPAIVVGAGPCIVVQEKAIEKDGYEATQVGSGDVREKLVNKPKEGHYVRARVSLERKLKEFELEDCSAYEVSQEVKADLSEAGGKIDVSRASKGKGFQGVIKKWNADRGPMTHGSGFHRAVSSMGASSDPSKTFKNKNIPRHMGTVNTAVLNLEIVKVTAGKSLILIKGGIPGPNKGTVVVRSTVKV